MVLPYPRNVCPRGQYHLLYDDLEWVKGIPQKLIQRLQHNDAPATSPRRSQDDDDKDGASKDE